MENTNITLSYSEKSDLRSKYGMYYEEDDKIFLEVVKDKYPHLAGIKVKDLMKQFYSENQLKFIKSALRQKIDIRYDYSGRGMYGDVCPAVVCKWRDDFKTTAKTITDSMGLDVVIYAQR